MQHAVIAINIFFILVFPLSFIVFTTLHTLRYVNLVQFARGNPDFMYGVNLLWVFGTVFSRILYTRLGCSDRLSSVVRCSRTTFLTFGFEFIERYLHTMNVEKTDSNSSFCTWASYSLSSLSTRMFPRIMNRSSEGFVSSVFCFLYAIVPSPCKSLACRFILLFIHVQSLKQFNLGMCRFLNISVQLLQ